MRRWYDVVLVAGLWGATVGLFYVLVIGAFGGGQVYVNTNRYNEQWVELPLFVLLIVAGAWRIWVNSGPR
ncbi:MAG: hypothetical protein HYY01_04875 [Chloroflexi bacterium]|nr:hypothetical protein [Chloroflexota bacterium]